MPRRDEIHDAVRNALIKDGWTITDDPFRMPVGDADVYADLRIARMESGSIVARALVIGIKGFFGISPVTDLEDALGQCELYRILLAHTAPDDRLYLVVSAETYAKHFDRPVFALIVQEEMLPLLLVDLDREEVVRWIN